MFVSLRLCLSAMIFGLVLVSTGVSVAQEEGTVTLPLAPDPARCTIEPRSFEDVQAVWEASIASPVPAPDPIPDDLRGTPADEETVAIVTELIVNVLACAANGNDGLRDAAYLTDEHLRDNVTGLSDEEFAQWYTESPVPSLPENWIMLYAVHNVEVLEDGRIKVNPDVIVPGVGHFIDTLLLKEVDGVWLIDQSQEGAGNIYPVTIQMMATPLS